jgi:hydrogenase nickel incorporation protein HypA/HybF
MHEMSLVRNILDIVKEEAEAAQAEKVTAVHLVVGEGRDIVEDLVQSLFQFLARGSVAEGAEVILQHVPYMVRCNQCQTEFHLEIMRPEKWVCPNCHAYKDYKLVSGQEFYISRIVAKHKNDCPAEKEGTPE